MEEWFLMIICVGFFLGDMDGFGEVLIFGEVFEYMIL